MPGNRSPRCSRMTSSSGTNAWRGAVRVRSGGDATVPFAVASGSRPAFAHCRRQRHEPRQHAGHLHDGEERVGVAGPAQRDREVERLVEQVRERVRRVDGQRREDREDFAAEHVADVLASSSVRSLGGADDDARGPQRRQHLRRAARGTARRPVRATVCRDCSSCSRGGIWSAPEPSGMPACTFCCRPPTRTMKNSSRFELKMARNFSRSSSGTVGSWASSRTRRLNSSQLSSRLMYRDGSSRLGDRGCTACSEERIQSKHPV